MPREDANDEPNVETVARCAFFAILALKRAPHHLEWPAEEELPRQPSAWGTICTSIGVLPTIADTPDEAVGLRFDKHNGWRIFHRRSTQANQLARFLCECSVSYILLTAIGLNPFDCVPSRLKVNTLKAVQMRVQAVVFGDILCYSDAPLREKKIEIIPISPIAVSEESIPGFTGGDLL